MINDCIEPAHYIASTLAAEKGIRFYNDVPPGADFFQYRIGAKEIAQKMNLDITTVSTYRRPAYDKLEVQNFVEMKHKFI